LLTLKAFKTAFRGSSFPTEVEATDGRTLVVKLRGAGNGAAALASELLVNRIAARAGFPVPDAEPIHLPEGFPWTFGTDEFDDLVQRSYGANLAIAYLPGATPLPADAVRALPTEEKRLLVALDIIFCNYDRTAASHNVLRTPDGRIWLVDHAACLVCDEKLPARPLTLPPHHILKGEEAELIDAEAMRRLTDPVVAAAAVAAVPDSWLAELKFPRAAFAAAVQARLQRFA
jgi:hypothetical protein